ncbi:MAG: hypothetical protein K2X27_01275, partial [Candidatus Obscuribacterales bacterium]|nr:hypothetical protein [Candidatus Obscuribacterales bacterium]
CCTTPAAESMASKLYEECLGPGSWQKLKSTSTLMPAKDMAELIDPYWSLPGAIFGHPAVSRLKHLPEQTRTVVLIEKLGEILQTVCKAYDVESPRSMLADKMSSSFIQDLVEPSNSTDWRELAKSQQEHYASSKASAGKLSNKSNYLCPLCNNSFSGISGTKASADFIDKPESHTNRASSHGSFDSIVICNGCYYEKLLMQLACGERPEEVIFIIPQLNLGPRHGEWLVERIRTWVLSAQLQLSEDGDLSQGFYLNLIQTPARKLQSQDPLFISNQELLALFMNPVSSDKQKDRQKRIIAALKEEFDNDLAEVNDRSGVRFDSWEDAAKAVLDKTVNLQEFSLIRREVLRTATLHLVCETPNMIMVPLSREISGLKDESDTSKALRKLFISLTLGLAFNARVAIKKEAESLELGVGSGCAYVAPLPAVRSLIGTEWIAIPDAIKWLRAIGAASLLVKDTKFPERNALFQVLSAEPAEWLARRIEQASDSGNCTLKQIELIEQLPSYINRKTLEKRL